MTTDKCRFGAVSGLAANLAGLLVELDIATEADLVLGTPAIQPVQPTSLENGRRSPRKLLRAVVARLGQKP